MDFGEYEPADANCLFCLRFGRLKAWQIDFKPLLNKVGKIPEAPFQALFNKYATVHNNHMSKDLDDLIASNSIPWVIQFKDEVVLEEDEEYLKRYCYALIAPRYYESEEHRRKLTQLFEYYKYHIDVPRIFINKLSLVVNKYYTRKKYALKLNVSLGSSSTRRSRGSWASPWSLRRSLTILYVHPITIN